MQGTSHHQTCEPWGGGGARDNQYNESSSIKSQKNLTQAILMRSQSDMSDKMLSVIYLSKCD
jgi:hypothetical protein